MVAVLVIQYLATHRVEYSQQPQQHHQTIHQQVQQMKMNQKNVGFYLWKTFVVKKIIKEIFSIPKRKKKRLDDLFISLMIEF